MLSNAINERYLVETLITGSSVLFRRILELRVTFCWVPDRNTSLWPCDSALYPVLRGALISHALLSIIGMFNRLDRFFGERKQGNQEATQDLNDLVQNNVRLVSPKQDCSQPLNIKVGVDVSSSSGVQLLYVNCCMPVFCI